MRRQGEIVILAHGGAGSKGVSRARLKTLAKTIQSGYSILKRGGTSLDAVEGAIRILEDSGQFNAGRGSRLQLDSRCRMDASIMEGKNLNAGAVAGIEGVKNPIHVARLIMEKTPHVLLVGDRVTRLARFYKVERGLSPTEGSLKILKDTLKKGGYAVQLYRTVYGHGTVGAVALDRSGNLAAGASTGGISAMLPGRIGDSPLIGSGVYADNEAGAVSITGWGEGIIRAGLAKEICCAIEGGMPPQKAAEKALRRLWARIHGEAGVIVLNRMGELAILHTTPFMCAGYRVEGQRTVVRALFRRVR